jgi:UDP-GlcNAc:undecaprenyl-phosphate GlcNAc-1-phosphate transferase
MNVNVADLFSIAVAFSVTASCLYLLRPLAVRLGLVDAPHGRKQHQGHIPLIGGMAMFLGFLFALLTLSISLANYRSLIAGCAVLVFIGVLDDFHELSTRSRFIAQVIAALLMASWGGMTLQNLGNLFFYNDLILHAWVLPLTVIAVVGVINAVNMTDGVDGLAGGVTLIELVFLLFLAVSGGQFFAAHILVLICAVVLAFLIFNFPLPHRKQALVFMGDAGSMFLGFVLVWFLIELSQGANRVAHPVTMLWIMTLPLLDIGGVLVRRLQKRVSLFMPDREHLHHVLQDLGWSNLQVTLSMCGMAVLFGLIGVVADRLGVPEGVMFVGFLGLFILYLGILKYSRKYTNKEI